MSGNIGMRTHDLFLLYVALINCIRFLLIVLFCKVSL